MTKTFLTLMILLISSCVRFSIPNEELLISQAPVPVIGIEGPTNTRVNSVIDILVKMKGLCTGRPDSGVRSIIYLPSEASKRTETTTYRLEEFFELVDKSETCSEFKDEYSVVYRFKFSEPGTWVIFSDNSVLKSRYHGYRELDEIPDKIHHVVSISRD